MIELQGLTKIYGDKAAVDDVSLRIDSGEFGVLIGPSGCGKSTTLRMINRLIPASRGRILLGDDDVTRLPAEQLRRRIGYAIQSIGLFPHWSVAENIAVVPGLLKWPKSRIAERVDELMALFHLDAGELRDKYPHQLSGGQAQRVGVARALAADPEVLLMDEPFGAVDPLTREVLQDELLRVHQHTRKTIVFVTHDMDEALKLASRIALLNAGRLVQYDRPIELLTRPADDFVRSFIGKADLGLKLLSRRWVHQYQQHATVQDASLAQTGYTWETDAEGRPICLHGGRLNAEDREQRTEVNQEWSATPGMTMKEALSRMVWFRVMVLPVLDDQGRLIGEVTMHGVMGQQPCA
ncbi:ABC transporter ATP-binding protein [Halomonas sp. McH1-25]|uniref:ABC transporter ATP-binding protein n=1 Tax=unclassified Halomonas TaxID=2609666 RepID=UPI001EF4E6E8|nr:MULTISPECIES: ABC transporter ATP-binding protein [unclassified Halomonas]MCG7601405.1 ABC transporter ATP-binding protein [Halomonas sp. McH1-25]MCP1341946.1 ABC transporter ATP-binding protein [Halomonas sp. FL8]MCP1361754.1 ABC transporter ATP-binding protein [Halomonas sp. BBD45]MCP1366868.1 ABC transporter ATP-binding protein [Halomonas sp. BBD48]